MAGISVRATPNYEWNSVGIETEENNREIEASYDVTQKHSGAPSLIQSTCSSSPGSEALRRSNRAQKHSSAPSLTQPACSSSLGSEAFRRSSRTRKHSGAPSLTQPTCSSSPGLEAFHLSSRTQKHSSVQILSGLCSTLARSASS
ncbi:hypothetical protein Nepgr_032408 [Nepenthes gracilis]|uniref:Uncharacterized protein n=1 Tax=Nepenthes gracilis TaxID=150966 RepID=A0AAD3TJ76_NEPGR|nr:hypothetical protein Nepgr_032408 [Nepenthes gracilis]